MTNDEKRNFIIQEILSSNDEDYTEYMTTLSKIIDEYDIIVDVKNFHNMKGKILYCYDFIDDEEEEITFDHYSDYNNDIYVTFPEQKMFNMISLDEEDSNIFVYVANHLIFENETELNRFKNSKEINYD